MRFFQPSMSNHFINHIFAFLLISFMKILHTADWHIGKVLHKQSLIPEMELFLDWLINVIDEHKIDLLLVSGDIFDIANPSVEDRKVYYRFLRRLIDAEVQVIITGGNHDSIGLIDAPHDILELSKINVVGGAKEDLRDEVIEMKNDDGNTMLVVAAVPFLRDRNLRTLASDKKFDNRPEALKYGIARHYEEVGNICKEDYPNIPAIAMGHLYARGASTSDSERDIHIGNAAAVESEIFPDHFDYVALGHIHRPQIIGKNPMIRYSGSPIALSFSEKKDTKVVVVLELKDSKFSEPEILNVPKWRELKKITGTYSEVSEKLAMYNPDFQLNSFVELEIEEEEFSAVTLAKVEQLLSDYAAHEKFSILMTKTGFKTGAKDTSDLFEKGSSIEDLRPLEVFEKLLEGEALSEEKEAGLKEAFMELLESVQQGGDL